jgi:homoserine O-acetyltransferase/O-succinyltransferase
MAIRGGLAAAIVSLMLGCSAPSPALRALECPPVSSPAPAAPATVAPHAPEPAVTTDAAPPPLLPAAPDIDPPQIGKIGDLQLESGEVIKDCQVEYRIIGAANADKSNVVVWPTWFSGITKDLLAHVGPGKLVDSAQYQVVLVGALANGVSSSPSNSPLQPRMRFPALSIRDMVESQHRLVTRVLGLSHVRAVMGISMGGMQTFQWGLAYPKFMDRLAPIVGSPRLAPYDLLLWQANLDAIEQDPAYAGGNYRRQPVLGVVQELADLNLTTPDHFNREQSREKFEARHAALTPPRFDANDRVYQLRAMMSHDVSRAFAGSMADAAKAVQAKLLVVVSTRDAMVTPAAALDFAKLAHAPTLILQGDCGHRANACEEHTVGQRLAAFLK